MIVKLLIEHHLEFLSLTEATPARLSLHLSKCHFVGNHMPRLVCLYYSVSVLSIPCTLEIACWERADLLALSCV